MEAASAWEEDNSLRALALFAYDKYVSHCNFHLGSLSREHALGEGVCRLHLYGKEVLWELPHERPKGKVPMQGTARGCLNLSGHKVPWLKFDLNQAGLAEEYFVVWQRFS
jgi:hypothetical protein